jgi:hypothetical protein
LKFKSTSKSREIFKFATIISNQNTISKIPSFFPLKNPTPLLFPVSFSSSRMRLEVYALWLIEPKFRILWVTSYRN